MSGARTASEELAEVLYEAMERLDPRPGYEPWEELSEGSRGVWWHALRAVLGKRELVEKAMAEDD